MSSFQNSMRTFSRKCHTLQPSRIGGELSSSCHIGYQTNKDSNEAIQGQPSTHHLEHIPQSGQGQPQPKEKKYYSRNEILHHFDLDRDESGPEGSKLNKLQQLREKKQRKQRMSLFVPPKNSMGSTSGFNSCSELRILLEKLSQQISKASDNPQIGISQDEIQRLKNLLDLRSALNIYQLMQEWIIDALILLQKEISLWKLPKCPQLQSMLFLKLQQIKTFIFSKQFQEVAISIHKKKIIMLKLKTNQINIWKQGNQEQSILTSKNDDF